MEYNSTRETLPNVHVVQCSELFGVCVVSKGAEKTRFNLKMIQKVKCEPFIPR